MPRCSTRLFFLFHSRFQFRQLSDRSKPIRACDEFSLAVSHLLASSRSCVYQRLSSSVYVYDCIGQLSTGLEKVLWNVSNAHGERGQLNGRAYVFYFFESGLERKKGRHTHKKNNTTNKKRTARKIYYIYIYIYIYKKSNGTSGIVILNVCLLFAPFSILIHSP